MLQLDNEHCNHGLSANQDVKYVKVYNKMDAFVCESTADDSQLRTQQRHCCLIQMIGTNLHLWRGEALPMVHPTNLIDSKLAVLEQLVSFAQRKNKRQKLQYQTAVYGTSSQKIANFLA